MYLVFWLLILYRSNFRKSDLIKSRMRSTSASTCGPAWLRPWKRSSFSLSVSPTTSHSRTARTCAAWTLPRHRASVHAGHTVCSLRCTRWTPRPASPGACVFLRMWSFSPTSPTSIAWVLAPTSSPRVVRHLLCVQPAPWWGLLGTCSSTTRSLRGSRTTWMSQSLTVVSRYGTSRPLSPSSCMCGVPAWLWSFGAFGRHATNLCSTPRVQLRSWCFNGLPMTSPYGLGGTRW
jgi:hypothetical protein